MGDINKYHEAKTSFADNSPFYQKQLFSLVENTKLGFLVQDSGGNIYETNQAFRHIFGITGKEIKNKKLSDILQEGNGTGCAEIAHLMSGARDCCDIETCFLKKDGKKAWVRVIGNQIKNEEGNPQYITFFIDDISERKEQEKIRNAFVDMVSHEMKNPLMAVMSSLRLAKKQGQFPDVLNELIAIASDGAESLWSILENLLEVSRARAGRLKISPVSTNVAQLIQDSLTTVRPTLIHKLTSEIPDSLPRIMVDPAKIQLILRNFLDNAIKYSPKGGDILVFVQQRKKEMVIGVKDHGIGISKEKLKNIFQPFERLGVTDTAGTGLGLIVCRMLATYHKGRIWVESEEGKGSIFYMALPLDD